MVAPEGTGKQAAIPGYRVSGKTGTAWKATAGGYSTDRYMAVFGGVAPATNPRLAAVVVIDEPGAGKYYGGEVAAPVFSDVVGGALRLIAVPPDQRRVATTIRSRCRRSATQAAHAMNAGHAHARALARAARRPRRRCRATSWSRDLTLDSRAARPARCSSRAAARTHHGLEFAPQAVARGARAVLYGAGAGRACVPDFGLGDLRRARCRS